MIANRIAETLLSRGARAAWPLVRRYNRAFERPAPHPAWAPGALPKRRERTKPPLGWPRETDSLCPRCVKEVRTADPQRRARSLARSIDGKPGEIRARILEEDGQS